MEVAYSNCAHEVGPGQYVRMKTSMTQHVQSICGAIFKRISKDVAREVNALKYSVLKQVKVGVPL